MRSYSLEDLQRDFPNDVHILPLYVEFCGRYGIADVPTVIRLYDAHELDAFMPRQPTDRQKDALLQLIGAQAASGYMDYQRSTNTFELIMQWQELCGNWLYGAANR